LEKVKIHDFGTEAKDGHSSKKYARGAAGIKTNEDASESRCVQSANKAGQIKVQPA